MSPTVSTVSLAPIQSPYLIPPEAAQYIKRKPGTLAVWRCQKRGPKFVLCGTRILYKVSDLDAFIDSCHTQRKAAAGVGRPPGSKTQRRKAVRR